MNRPYGAVDVAANLKGAVPKATTQKILVALAEKGQLVQKTYGKAKDYPIYASYFTVLLGKTTFFVINQSNIESVPTEGLAALEAEWRTIEEQNKILAADLRDLNAELSKLKSEPDDHRLNVQIEDTDQKVTGRGHTAPSILMI